ncbi:hypothetical protein [Streptomyces sp. NPDC052015]|uniref:hypothetical protein n=1 Tax=Streptomyces sp. NPDC052015 TaxID=3154755 RepID=UPI003435BDD2
MGTVQGFVSHLGKRPAADSEEAASDDAVRAQLAMTEVTGAAGIRYSLFGSLTSGEPEMVEFHVVRVFRGVTGTVDFSGTRDECLAYIESEAAVRSAAEAVDENSEEQATALAWLRERQTPAAAPAASEEMTLPALDVDVPPLGPAEPYATDTEAQAGIDRLGEAFARWEALPSVQRYYEADRQQRPDGIGDPTNPLVQLAEAYQDAERTLRVGPVGSPDDLVRQVHTVAAWSGALEPVVDEDLRGLLREIREAAVLLASRSQATVESFEAELAALAANSEGPTAGTESVAAETESAEQDAAASPPAQAPVDTDAAVEARPEPGPEGAAADTGPTVESSATGPETVLEAPEPAATLAVVQAERAAVREEAAAAAPRPEVQSTPPPPADTAVADPGTRQNSEESRTPEVPESQSPETAREESPAAPARHAGDDPALDAAVDGIRQALEDALQAGQPETAAQSGELPLWTGTEASPADTAATEPSTGPLDVRSEFQAVMDAWNEHAPPENGTAQDLVADLDADLTTLQQAFAEAVAPAAPATPPSAVPGQTATSAAESAGAEPVTPIPQQAAAVNAALQGADAHAGALQDLPEWQNIQTVRGAFGHLFRVMRERAGEHFDRLMGDHRIGEFFRKVSIRACEKVAQWAQAGADRLRRGGKRDAADTPGAEALRRLGDAASTYSSPGGRRSGPPSASRDAASTTVDIPSMRKLGDALARPLPGAKDGRGPRVSTAAARGKSTTRQGPKKPSGATEQADHLRRGANEQQTRKSAK